MMIVIGFLTVILVLDCLLLILLVLVQLPKKEAGIGQAFGGAATDALFGAGSGNALTKMTKYSTAIFFILTLTISLMFNFHARNKSSGFERSLGKNTPAAALPPATPANNLPTTPVGNAAGVGNKPQVAPANGGAAAPAAAENPVTTPKTGAATPAPTTTAPATAPTTPTPATK
jgi:preprotein translocase subunit SecG